MNKLLSSIFLLFTLINGIQTKQVDSSNGCVSFTVGQGTGCDWMCNYCSTQLGTSNYYFTDNVCTYQFNDREAVGSGCVGNPIAGKQYTCCSVNEVEGTLSLEEL